LVELMAIDSIVKDTAVNQTPTSQSAPRLLFIPVSGTYGMGEYARSLAIARAASRRWQHAAIHFILSREAPYAPGAPFPATLLPSSPTFHSAAVIELIEKWRPDVVIFDNAGRTSQLRAAQRSGARVVYISARRRQRRKAFRWHWMRLIDEHWIAYPEFIAGSLGLLERLKLRLAGRPVVRYLDVILSRALPGQREAILSRAGCDAGTFVLVVPGGGTGHPGADDAVDRFMAAGQALAASGVPTVYVGPVNAPSAADAATPNWHPLGPVPQADLAELMRSARLILANGGSTLLQAIACGSACIAVPIAKDQAERTRRCVATGVAVTAARDSAGMVQAAQRLLQDERQRAALAGRAAHLALADGVEVALKSLAGLLKTARHAPAP
jgi:glycosyltransferase involved in cell wall biosynthesis